MKNKIGTHTEVFPGIYPINTKVLSNLKYCRLVTWSEDLDMPTLLVSSIFDVHNGMFSLEPSSTEVL